MHFVPHEIAEKIRLLPDTEKIELVDQILEELDKPDPEIDRVWAEEAKKRLKAYKKGQLKTIDYDDVMSKYKR
jgi:putative addiction module component (TIGR02574 family)